MDPSVCRLHPGVAVTGSFCPACLRDRLAGLQPSSSADLRRCKSFSYARSAVSQLEPQRRSCDLFRQEQAPVIAVPEQEVRRMEAEEEPSRKSSFGALLGKKLQQWRRKKKEPPVVREEMPSRHRQHSFRDLDGRRSCDLQLDPASWSSGPIVSVDRMMNPAMLSVEEEEDYMPAAVPRSDGQIPVEEDYYDPGGCAQTRDYYMDSSSSSRRRRSTSSRNSFSDVVHSELPSRSTMATNTNANSRGSPAIAAAEFYHAHHQSVLVHHHHHQYHHRDWNQPGSGRFDDSSSFRPANNNKEANKQPKKGIKGWSIWGLIQKKSSSSRKPEAAVHGSSFSSVAASAGVVGGDHPWPELRARGYNGQMLRCNSSISARSSFSGGAAMIGGSARRSISGQDLEHDVLHGSSWRTTRRDEVLLERNLSARPSYSRSGHDHPLLPAAGGNYYQFSRLNHKGEVRSSKSKPSALRRKSTLGPYSTTDPVPRQ